MKTENIPFFITLLLVGIFFVWITIDFVIPVIIVEEQAYFFIPLLLLALFIVVYGLFHFWSER